MLILRGFFVMFQATIHLFDAMIPLCESHYGPDLLSMQRAYCYRQLPFLRMLAADLQIARHSGISDSARVIIGRSVMEALFRLAASIEDPQTALDLIYTNVCEQLKGVANLRDASPQKYHPYSVEIIAAFDDELSQLNAITTRPLRKRAYFNKLLTNKTLLEMLSTSYNSFSGIAHGDYTILEICRKGGKFSANLDNEVIRCFCIAGAMACDYFSLDKSFQDSWQSIYRDLLTA